jgi:hypothetical protein
MATVLIPELSGGCAVMQAKNGMRSIFSLELKRGFLRNALGRKALWT